MYELNLKIEQHYVIDNKTNFNIIELKELKEKLLNEITSIIISKYPQMKEEKNITNIELDITDVPF